MFFFFPLILKGSPHNSILRLARDALSSLVDSIAKSLWRDTFLRHVEHFVNWQVCALSSTPTPLLLARPTWRSHVLVISCKTPFGMIYEPNKTRPAATIIP